MYNPPTEISKLYRKLASHTCVIINKENPNLEKELISTGILVKIKDNYFIFTVKHGIEVQNVDKIGISFGLATNHNFRKEIWTHPEFDLAFIKLEWSEIKFMLALHTEFFVPVQRHLVKISTDQVAPCCGVGFPKKNINFKNDEKLLVCETLFFTAEWIHQKERVELLKKQIDQFDDRFEALLDCTGKYYNETGDEVKFDIDPHGLSGSAIWIYNPDTINDDKPKYTLFGIQGSALIDQRTDAFKGILKIASVKPLFDEIERRYS